MITRLSIFLCLLFLPLLAQAHTGLHEGASFSAGFFHPLQGIDHLIVMVAVGVLALRQGGRNVYLLPLTFVSVMAASALLALNGIDIPGAETGILWSNPALIALVVVSHRFSTAASLVIIGFFALFHGFAHGAEMPAASDSTVYMAGFASATLLLHGLGLALAWQFSQFKTLGVSLSRKKI